MQRYFNNKNIEISTKEVLAFTYSFLVFASLFQVNKYEVGFVGGLSFAFKIIKLSVLIIYFVRLLVKKFFLTRFDIIIMLSLLCILISGFVNRNVFIESLGTFRNGLVYWVLIKWMLEKDNLLRTPMLEGGTLYLVIVCSWNTIYAFVVGGPSHINRFVLGADNESANIYFLSCFFSYLLICFNERCLLYKMEYVVSILSTIIFTMYMRIGSMLLWGFATLLMFIYCYLKRYKVNFSFVMILYFGLLAIIAVVSSNLNFSKIVQRVFWGKNVSSRVLLWSIFMAKVNRSPLFGLGASPDKYARMEEGVRKFLLFGNCHNIFVDIVYHFGYVTLILIIIAVFLALRKHGKLRNKWMGLCVFWMSFLFHGIVEAGMLYMYLYLPVLFWASQLLDDARVSELKIEEKIV